MPAQFFRLMSSTNQHRQTPRPLEGGSWIDRVMGMMERLAPGLMKTGDASDFATKQEDRSRIAQERRTRIRQLYATAQRRGPVDIHAIAAQCGVSYTLVLNHTRDLRAKVTS